MAATSPLLGGESDIETESYNDISLTGCYTAIKMTALKRMYCHGRFSWWNVKILKVSSIILHIIFQKSGSVIIPHDYN